MKSRFYRFKHHFSYIEKWVIFNVVFLTISASSFAQTHPITGTSDPDSQHTQVHQKLLSLAENGDQDAQYNLGRIYLQGKGTRQDYQAARKWFMRAARKKRMPDPIQSGKYLSKRTRDSTGLQKSLFLVQKAAAKFYAPAQYALGKLYSSGCGVNQNSYKSTEWILKAAYNGMPEAQFQIGYRYLTGYGIQVDKNKAYEWLLKAAKQDNPAAIKVLKTNFSTEI